LVVDDEPELLEIFGKWVAAEGCVKVLTAANGKEALAVLASTRVDVLVTDVRMPVMDGIELVRMLGKMGSSVPSIIFVSGFGQIDLREMYGLGVETFLSKPLSRTDFTRALERALAERAALWLAPMAVTPRQTLVTDGARICLGRGGLSVDYVGLLMSGPVAFHCRFAPENRHVVGQGYVRWTWAARMRAGIEFVFVEPQCRAWVVDRIGTTQPRSFIPVE